MYPKEQNAIDVYGKGYVQDITDWNEDSIRIWKDCIHSVHPRNHVHYVHVLRLCMTLHVGPDDLKTP